MSGIWLLIASIMVSVFIMIMFFHKRNIKSLETYIYSRVIIINFLFSFLGTLIYFLAMKNTYVGIIALLQKLYLVSLVYIATYIFSYIVAINKFKNKTHKIIITLTSILTMLSSILVLTTPINPIIQGDIVDIEGVAYDIAIVTVVFYFVLTLICTIRFFMANSEQRKKIFPIVTLLVLFVMGLYLRVKFPEVITETFICSFSFLMMYFTIENPDIKMLEIVNNAKDAAERANKAKSDFLSSMSHEIRTPLNAIVGFSECILEEQDLERAKQDAKDIVMASQNLLEIVNGILDISKIEADKMEIINSEYCLIDNMNNIVKLMIPRIGEKPITLNVKYAEDIPGTLYGDIGKIKQIVTNLLTNAVKYTEKGIINFEINCINKGGICTLVISVEDTGKGIKPEKIDSIFNKFERLEEDRNTTIEGTGLGLAITKRLSEMLGGKVVVQSKYGSGSKFTAYLRQRIINNYNKTISEEVSMGKVSFDGKKVLLVDDNKINLKVAHRLLEPFNVSIEECESGFDCLKLVETNKYDLILLDDMMPGMSGRETLEKLKVMSGFRTPTVALTANAIEGMKEDYLSCGFDDYLAKPIDKLELERVLRKTLGGSKDILKNKFEPLPDELFDMDIPL